MVADCGSVSSGVLRMSRPDAHRAPLALIAGGAVGARDVGELRAARPVSCVAASDLTGTDTDVAHTVVVADQQRIRIGVTSGPQMSLFDVDWPDGQSAIRVDEHVGGLGQTAMFGSDLALGEDDAELRRKDAERHAAQVDEALERVAREHGPLSAAEHRLLSGLAARSERSAARFELLNHMRQALLRSRALDPA